MEIDLFFKSVDQVINAPLFWGSMGFTVAIAMFVGAIIYDGNMEEAKKGVFAVLSYVFMIFWVTIIRVNDALSGIEKTKLNSVPVYANAYNGITTIIIITLFWLIGLMFGVIVFKVRYSNFQKELKKFRTRYKL